jgi:hypothetical protein
MLGKNYADVPDEDRLWISGRIQAEYRVDSAIPCIVEKLVRTTV